MAGSNELSKRDSLWTVPNIEMYTTVCPPIGSDQDIEFSWTDANGARLTLRGYVRQWQPMKVIGDGVVRACVLDQHPDVWQIEIVPRSPIPEVETREDILLRYRDIAASGGREGDRRHTQPG